MPESLVSVWGREFWYFSFYGCEVTEREVSSGGVNGIWEDELPRGWERRQGINEIERMN